jgi:two-component system, cell cycle response regulator
MTCYWGKLMKYFNNEQISRTCSFKDKDFELSYLTQSYSKFKHTMVPLFSIAFVLLIFFSIPDYIYKNSVFQSNLELRIFAAFLCITFYFIFGKLKNFLSYLFTINAVEISFIIIYLLMISNYSDMNYVIKCMDIIILISIYFAFPNKWLNSTLSTLALMSSFFIFSAINAARFTQDNNFASGSVYILIAFVLTAFNSYRANYHARAQFYKTTVLKKLINTDTLTGAFTRAKFNEDIKNHIFLSKQTGRRFSITIFDIDNFKHFNDTYGHIEGDNVLTGIAEAIITNKRSKDILIRWGGEEFVILFPSTTLSAAVKITERLRQIIATADFNLGEHITCSFGVTEFQSHDTPVSLLGRADNHLYEAKARGKNRVVSDIQFDYLNN